MMSNYILCTIALTVTLIVFTTAFTDPNDEFKLEIISGHTDNCYNGKKSKRGDKLQVNYIGILKETGKQFDSRLF